jgi:hypothetical protein
MLLEEVRRINRSIACAQHCDVEMGPVQSCPLIREDMGQFFLLDDTLLKQLCDQDSRNLGEQVITLVFD